MCITNEQLREMEYRIREDILKHVSKRIDELGKHINPSQETINRLCSIEDWRKKHEELAIESSKKQDRIIEALFGDEMSGDLGMVKEHKILYKQQVGIDGVKGFFRWILLSGGVVGILFALFRKF